MKGWVKGCLSERFSERQTEQKVEWEKKKCYMDASICRSFRVLTKALFLSRTELVMVLDNQNENDLQLVC